MPDTVRNSPSTTGDGDDLRNAIGGLVVDFAQLEFNLAHATSILIGTEEIVSQAVVSRLSFKNLVDLYCTLLRLRSSDDLSGRDINSLFRELVAEEAFRNAAMHSLWLPDVEFEGDDGVSKLIGSHLRVKLPSLTRKGTGVKAEFVEPAAVRAHAGRARALAGKVVEILPKMPRRVVLGRRRELGWPAKPPRKDRARMDENK